MGRAPAPNTIISAINNALNNVTVLPDKTTPPEPRPRPARGGRRGGSAQAAVRGLDGMPRREEHR